MLVFTTQFAIINIVKVPKAALMNQQKTVINALMVVTTTTIVLLSTLYTRSVSAAINEAFTYQGKIVNTDGTNVSSVDASCINDAGADSCDFKVSIYTASTGGTLVWQETKSDVEIGDNNGIFNLILDCGGTFSTCNQNGGPNFSSGNLYTEVEFDPSGNGDFSEGETFDPRKELTAVPYAFYANSADTASTIDGIDSTSLLRSDANDTFDSGFTLSMDGTMDINGDIVISDSSLVFDGANTDFSISGNLSINTDDLFIEKSTGFIGIGTTDPTVKLDVSGSIRATNNIDVEGYAALGNGSTLDPNSGLIVDYDTTYTSLGQQILVQGSVIGAAATNVFGVRIEPESMTIPTGTTNLAASLYINEPNIIEAGTLSNSASIYVAGAASEAGNNYALWIDSGAVQIDEDLTVSNTVKVGSNLIIGGSDQISADIFLGSSGLSIFNEQGNDSDFRIDGSGPSLESIFFADASSGRIGIGTSTPSAYLDLVASTSNAASARIRTGSTPASPNEGDLYSDGSNLYYRNSSSWETLNAGDTLQESYVGGNTIDISSSEGALNFDAVSANLDIEIGQGTDTGNFRVWDGTNNWFLIDEATSGISLGNGIAATGLTLTSGSNWSFSSAGALTGVTTLSSSGDWTWNATSPTITIASGETFSITDGADTYNVNTTTSSFGMSDGSNSITFDLDTGPTYSGSARPTKKMVLSPEYQGAVLTPFYGAGTDTNISGTMTSDGETTPASSIKSYYSWVRNATTQHFYTVAVRVKLPQDFSTWATTNAVVINYVTQNATSTNSSVDARIYLEGNGTVDASSTGNASVSWTTVSFNSSDLDLWNAAGETAVIYLRLGSQSGNYARVGDVELTYLSAF